MSSLAGAGAGAELVPSNNNMRAGLDSLVAFVGQAGFVPSNEFMLMLGMGVNQQLRVVESALGEIKSDIANLSSDAKEAIQTVRKETAEGFQDIRNAIDSATATATANATATATEVVRLEIARLAAAVPVPRVQSPLEQYLLSESDGPLWATVLLIMKHWDELRRCPSSSHLLYSEIVCPFGGTGEKLSVCVQLLKEAVFLVLGNVTVFGHKWTNQKLLNVNDSARILGLIGWDGTKPNHTARSRQHAILTETAQFVVFDRQKFLAALDIADSQAVQSHVAWPSRLTFAAAKPGRKSLPNVNYVAVKPDRKVNSKSSIATPLFPRHLFYAYWLGDETKDDVRKWRAEISAQYAETFGTNYSGNNDVDDDDDVLRMIDALSERLWPAEQLRYLGEKSNQAAASVQKSRNSRKRKRVADNSDNSDDSDDSVEHMPAPKAKPAKPAKPVKSVKPARKQRRVVVADDDEVLEETVGAVFGVPALFQLGPVHSGGISAPVPEAYAAPDANTPTSTTSNYFFGLSRSVSQMAADSAASSSSSSSSLSFTSFYSEPDQYGLEEVLQSLSSNSGELTEVSCSFCQNMFMVETGAIVDRVMYCGVCDNQA
jgi:gas vesicle protein